MKYFMQVRLKNSLPIRLSQHNHNLQKGGIDKASIYLLDEVEENNWEFWERYWIQQFKQWGFNLSNKNNGGGGPLTHSENVVKKIMKDKNFIEIGKKISKAKFGAKYNITIRG